MTTEHDLGRGFRLSLGLHGALLLFIIIKTLIFPGKPIPYVPTLRVDMVGLPDLLKQDLSKIQNRPDEKIAKALKDAEKEAKSVKPLPAPPKEAKPAEPADPHELVLKPTQQQSAAREKKLKSALDRIKALEKISGESRSPKAEAVVIKGNKLSKGSSLSADARESDQTNYYDLIRDRLQSNWELPVWIARQEFSAQVQLFIDGQGRVQNYRFVRPSGNAQFDDAIKRTIAESQPFAPPPDSIASSISSNGILVGFPL